MKKLFLLHTLLLTLFFSAHAQKRIYVNAAATGANTGGTWADAFADLNRALNAAQSGDSIWAAAGTYKPTAGAARDSSFHLRSGVTLFGGFAGTETQLIERDWQQHPTVLSGDIGVPGDSTDNSFNIMYMENPDSFTVADGLIFRYGLASPPAIVGDQYGRSLCGGALYIMGYDEYAYPNIRNCRFEHNSAKFYGGAVFVNGLGDFGSVAPQFLNCVFESNNAARGGAIYRYGGSWAERTPDFGHCTFLKNSTNGAGGAIYYSYTEHSDTLEFVHCDFVNNRSSIGGGIFLKSSNGSLIVEQCRFDTNNSGQGSAISTSSGWIPQVGLKLFRLKKSVFENQVRSYVVNLLVNDAASISEISECLFKNNKRCSRVLVGADGEETLYKNLVFEGNEGTAFHFSGKSYDLQPLLISDVTIKKQTGFDGYRFPAIELFHTSTPVINNLVIAESTMPMYYILSGSSVQNLTVNNAVFEKDTFRFSTTNDGYYTHTTFQNCAFSRNQYDLSTFFLDYPSVTLNHCSFDAFNCAAQPSHVTCGPGLLTGLDPLFVAPDSADYRLQPCSPLVNAGNNAYVSASNTTDLGGQPRIQGGTVDIGAYETAPPALTAAPAVLPACKGQPNGAVSLPTAGGCAPITYQWASAGGQSGSGTGGLAAGQYTFTVSDQRGSTFTLSLAVPDSGSVALSATALPVVCGDTLGGTAIAHAQGGTPPLGFGWAGSPSTDSLRSGLPPGTYAVTVTDERGCTATATAEVKKQGNLSSEAEVGAISCFGAADGSLTVSPVGGKAPFDWSWQGSASKSPTLAPLGPGEYRLTLTDAWGCEAVWALPLTQPDSLRVGGVALSPASDSVSADGKVSVTVEGGTSPYAGLWSNGQPGLSLTGLAPGTYTLTLTDANACSFTASYVVGVTSGTHDLAPQISVQVWPSPFEERLLVAFSPHTGAVAEGYFSLRDMLGRTVLQVPLYTGVQEVQTDDLPPGVYFWEVSLVPHFLQNGGKVAHSSFARGAAAGKRGKVVKGN